MEVRQGSVAEIPIEVRRLLNEHAQSWWEDTTERLILYAQGKIKMRRWMGVFGGDPPEGWEANDFVQVVFEKVFSGSRKWDPKEYPDLFVFLRAQVDSEISNKVTSSANKKLRTASVLPEGAFEPVDEETPEAALIAKERERLGDEFFWGFFEQLGDEPELQRVVEAIVDGMKRAEMAHHMGVTVEKIDALKKRLGRRLKSFQAAQVMPAAQKGGTTRA